MYLKWMPAYPQRPFRTLSCPCPDPHNPINQPDSSLEARTTNKTFHTCLVQGTVTESSLRSTQIPLICLDYLYDTIHRLNGFQNRRVCSVLVRLLPGPIAPLSLTLSLSAIPFSTLHPSLSYRQRYTSVSV